MKKEFYVLILSSLLFVISPVYSQTYNWNVLDKADDNAYSGNWDDGSNGGAGFSGWSFVSTGTGGRYIGSTAIGDDSFGIYADGDSYSATRPFEKPLKSGDTFTVDIGHTSTIDGEIGLTLLDGSSGVITLKFVGGATYWQFNDGGSDFNIGQAYDDNIPLTFSFTYNGGSSYSFSFGSASGDDYTANSNISNIDGVNFYNNDQGAGQNFGFNNLAISGAASSASDVPTNADVEISGNVELGSTETLTVNDLTIPSSKAGTLTLKSDASGTASLIVNGTINGDVAVERYINGYTINTDGWHLMSSPVASFAIAGSEFEPTAGVDDFYSWNEAAGNWYNYEQPSGPDDIVPGEAYLIAYDVADTKTFSGTVNNSDIPFSNLSYTGTSTNQGWHLLGNPYPSALQWDQTSWNRTNVDALAKLWDEGNAGYVDLNPGDIIPAMNGFMIHVNNSTNAITIPKAERTHSTTAWYKNDILNKLKLTVYDLEGSTAQQSVLQFDANATAGFDSEFDSYYLNGYAPQFYSLINGKPASTNTLPEVNEELQVPYHFIKNASSTYRLEVEGIASLGLSMPVYITDYKTGQTIDISETGYYEFEAMEGDEIARFMLHFKTTGIDDVVVAEPVVAFQNQQLTISDLQPGQVDLRVVDVMGRVVLSAYSEANGGIVNLPINLKSGIYILEIVINNHRFAHKFSVN